MSIGFIAFIVFILLAVIMKVSPQLLIREDKRDDPDAIEQTKKCGNVMLGFAAAAALLVLKYSII
ncbi:MAG: hypothetical protein IKO47_09495 [Ruminococcus sp.]|nr:hypothetical protein [Ruminococcus sp.]